MSWKEWLVFLMDPHTVVIVLIIVSYISMIILINFMGTMATPSGDKFFTNSTFFTSGYQFTMFGLDFENRHYFNVLCFFFFFNSLVFNLNVSIINPLFQRIIFMQEVEIDKKTQGFLSLLLLLYNVWSVFRSLFALVGMTSNVWFFMWNSIGFLLGDLVIRNIYIMKPHTFKFDYTAPVKAQVMPTTHVEAKTGSKLMFVF